MKHPERIQQQKFVGHVREFYPDMLFWHTPSGEERHGRIAVTLLQMGTRPGVPDLFFPTLKLFIEFKAPGEKESPAQKYVRQVLEFAGYTCLVYDDWQAAFAEIERRVRECGSAWGKLTGLPDARR